MKYYNRKLNAEMPSTDDVLLLAPSESAKEILRNLDETGHETVFHRFEKQQPQCGTGIRGLCCQMCQWGPCRIKDKNSRGICGRDLNQVVMGNLLRALNAGLAAHARHAHEVILTIIAAAEGRADIEIKGETRVIELAKKFDLYDKQKDINEMAKEVSKHLIEDLNRMDNKSMHMLEAYAPQELKELWRKLDIMPRSSTFEIMESLHMTTLGGCTDWQAFCSQELRSALAYCYNSLYASSFGTEILYGIPQVKETEVNYGVMKEDHVNILVHGHSPVMIEKVLEKINTSQIQELAKEKGAKGIVVGGMCCTGSELLARYGIPTVTSIMGQELAIGTGAVDTVVVDMQCVTPGLKILADCFGTEVITTCKSNRIPGATHIPFDPDDAQKLNDDALEVAKRAVGAFENRDRSKIKIPTEITSAKVGWSLESILDTFGGEENIINLLREGKIKGIATVVGCNNPKVPYERNHVTIVEKLIKSGILITTTGCSSHALLNAGLCSVKAKDKASEGLKEVCEKYDVPPVLTVGGCVDNTRTLRLFIKLAEHANISMHKMPFMFIGPEPGNEKTVGQGVSFLAHGISNLSGFPAPIPLPVPYQKEGARFSDDMDPGRNDIVEFFAGEGLKEKVGAKVFTEPYPKLAAQRIKLEISNKRKSLGW